jgi:outer membrane lipoprotein SlyB
MNKTLNDTFDSLRNVVTETLNNPRRAAAVGAATGALKGAAVGIVAGKVIAFTVLGAATGATFAAVVSSIARNRTTTVPEALTGPLSARA